MFKNIIKCALEEDLGCGGDITTSSILGNEEIKFTVTAREDLIVSGMAIVKCLSEIFSDDITLTCVFADGASVCAGNDIITGVGKASRVLSVERVLLNFLQRASGISSLTRSFVREVSGTNAVIRCTRKTSPCLRKFDLYAVAVGGGACYRSGLYDGVMIKDNHIACCGSISECVSRVRQALGDVVMTVECDTVVQVEEAVRNSVTTVLLDNMAIDDIISSVRVAKDCNVKLEVSGGINIDNVRRIAELGVDFISVGSITHSCICKDIGLDICHPV